MPLQIPLFSFIVMMCCVVLVSIITELNSLRDVTLLVYELSLKLLVFRSSLREQDLVHILEEQKREALSRCC